MQLSKKHWFRRVWIALPLAVLAWYLYSHYCLRKDRYLVHHRSESPVRHQIILSGEEGRFLFMALAVSGRLKDLDRAAAALQREQQFCYWFYTPCRYGEVCYWYLVDH